jgi:membrane complex biogenesis BtpA family protein
MMNEVENWRDEMDSYRMHDFKEVFGNSRPVIGMVHLPPLPGAVGYRGYGMQQIIDFALRDAERLVEGGVDGLIVENMWDLPYAVGHDVSPEQMCSQAVAAHEVVRAVKVPVGINVIHNGGRVVLGVAIAAGAKFVRVCLLTGAQIWDTGEFDHGCARELLTTRKLTYSENIKLFCDVDKKHSVRFEGIDLETHIEWTNFYLADALIISGKMTGSAPTVEKVRKAREAIGSRRPILMGSGTTAENVAGFLQYADGCIVGSSLKEGDRTENPVSVEKVKRYMEVVEGVRKASRG